MSKKQFEQDAYNFAIGCSDPRSGVDIFLEGAEWGYDYAVSDKDKQIAALEKALEIEDQNNAAELGQLRAENRRLREALKQQTCGFCEAPCGNDWCPTKTSKKD